MEDVFRDVDFEVEALDSRGNGMVGKYANVMIILGLGRARLINRWYDGELDRNLYLPTACSSQPLSDTLILCFSVTYRLGLEPTAAPRRAKRLAVSV